MNGSVLFEGNPILSGSLNVNTGGNIEPLEIEINENGTREIIPPSGVDGYAPITIETNIPQVEPVLETLNITQNGTYTPPSGVDGYDEIVVNVPGTPLSSLAVTANGTYTAPAGTGYNEVNVNVPLPSNAYLLKELSNLPQPIASFSDGADAVMQSLKVDIIPVQSGSGDPSPTNVRPISGWSGCNVGNLGSKNWYDTRQSLLAGYLNGDGTAGGTGQSINKHTEKIPIKGGITYTYSVAVSRNADQVCLWYDKNNNVIDGFVLLKNTTSITAQAPINAESVSLTVYNVDGQTIQLEAGSQATAYEPYNPNSTTTTIPFTDSQGNPVEVYGGSVDVVDGVVTPCPYYASYNGEQLTGEWISDRDVYSPNTTPTIGAQVVNIGATGTPFSVQPTSIKSLDGENNVFASTGDVEELKYFTKATS